MFEFEKIKLYNYLGKNLVEICKKNKIIIAGGAITSLFTNKDINDIDIYFRDKESISSFLDDVWDNGIFIKAQTKKAILFQVDNIDIQCISIKFFKDSQEIFNSFDFTVCMGSFDFADEQFYLHDDFLKHNSQRIIVFNSNTMFPIVSALRVQKYEKKGFKIAKTEYLKILFSCMKLEIKSFKELQKHVGGMYGVNLESVFNSDEEFSLDKAIDKASNLYLDENYSKEPELIEFDSVDDILDNILEDEVKYFTHNNKNFRIKHNGGFKNISSPLKDGVMIDVKDVLLNQRYYKFVKKINDNQFMSFYDNKFIYEIDKESVAKNGRLYCGLLQDVGSLTYNNSSDAVLIELEIEDVNDFIGVENYNNHLLLKKCKTIREVPKEEYKKYM